MITLFLDNLEVLATHPSQYGEIEVLEMRIDLVQGAIPYKSRVRPLNPYQKENLETQINERLEQGVIEPSVSPWVSPLGPVKKKDGWTRRVTDLRELNKQTIKDSFPLTNLQEILHSLQGATVFLSLDACGAYHAAQHSVHQPLQHVPVSMYAVWISQCLECVQQDAGRSHEGGGQRRLEVIPG